MRYSPPFLWAIVAAASLEARSLAQAPAKPPEGVMVLRDQEYVPQGHARQKLDLYLPEKAQEPLPVIVWIHGGAWRAGSKNYCPAVPYSAKGFAVASINYRFSEHAVF